MKKISFVVLALVLSTVAFAQPVENFEPKPTHPGHVAEVQSMTISGPAKSPVVELGPTELRYPGQPVVYPSSELVVTRTPRSTAAIASFLEPTEKLVSRKMEHTEMIERKVTLKVISSAATIQASFPDAKDGFVDWVPGGDPVRPHSMPPIKNREELFSDEYARHWKAAIKRFEVEGKEGAELDAVHEGLIKEMESCEEGPMPDYIQMMINGVTVTRRMRVNQGLMKSLGSPNWCSVDSELISQKIGVVYFCDNIAIAYTQPFFRTEAVELFLPQFRPMTIDVTLPQVRAVIRAQLVRGILPPVPKRVFPPPVEISKKKGCGPKCLLPLAGLGLIPLFLGGDDTSAVGNKPVPPGGVISPN